MKKLMTIILLFSISYCSSQTGIYKTYLGDPFEQIRFNSIVQAPSGNLNIACVSSIGEENEVFLLELNSDGDFINSYFPLPTFFRLINIKQILLAQGGGYFIVGNDNDGPWSPESSLLFLAKLGEDFSLEWIETFHEEGIDIGNKMVQLSNDEILAIGGLGNGILMPQPGLNLPINNK